jgi:hypothetical protein
MVSTPTELQNALSQANLNNGNTTIMLNRGTYQLTNNLLYISSNMKHLTIRGATGNRDDVIIKGQGMNGNVTHIFNVAASDFILADMTIGWVFYHPVQIHGESDADNCIIHNVKIIDGNEQFIKISGSSTEAFTSDGGIIECCHFEFSAGIGNQYYTGGVDGHHCNNWIIRNNSFKNLRSPDGNLAEHAIHFWSNSKNILVENNFISNCDRGIGFGLGDDPTRGNFGGIIRNNFVHTSRDIGIGIERTPDLKIYNNTVWTDNHFNSIEYRFNLSINLHIANNLTNKNIASREGGLAKLDKNFTNAVATFFKDPANYNYHLALPVASLIGQGINLTEVITDIDCELRGNTNDIGADQYQAATASSQENNFQITIFPNPVHENSSIEINGFINEIVHLKFFKSDGEPVMSMRLKIFPAIINLSELPPGLYFAELSTIKFKNTFKIVK